MQKASITFDLETLGNNANSPIIQLGAVRFYGDEVNPDDIKEEDKFIRNINMKSLQNYGFEVNYDTIEWWFKQEDKAIKSIVNVEDKVDIRQALSDFRTWLVNPADYVYWSHATFDPPILTNALVKTGVGNFIRFTSHRDIRTLTHLVGGHVNVDRVGVHHNALDDCIYQALYINKSISIIEDRSKVYKLRSSNEELTYFLLFNIVRSTNKDTKEDLLLVQETFDKWIDMSLDQRIEHVPDFETYFNSEYSDKVLIQRLHIEFISKL